MPISMRNPFKRQDENARPSTTGTVSTTTTTDGDAPNTIDIKEKHPVEYQLSEINDSGVYLPPSPTERKNFWGTAASRSTTSSSVHRCAFNENEPFNISRESFDSYRRSFDISARSPIIQPESRPARASLDSRTFLPPPRSSNSFNRPLQVPQTQEEEDRFEDVNIDEPKQQPPPKKRGILARIVDGSDHSEPNGRPTSSHENKSAWHHFGGRKRGQSGQGAELGSIPKRDETPKPEKQLSQLQQQQPKAEEAMKASKLEKATSQALQVPQIPQQQQKPEEPPNSAKTAKVERSALQVQQQQRKPEQVTKAFKTESTPAAEITVDS